MRRYPFDPPVWIVVLFAVAMFLLIVNACYVHADHTLWPIVGEKQLTDWGKKGLRYRLVEYCVSQELGLCVEISTPLPRLATSASVPCRWDPNERCLPEVRCKTEPEKVCVESGTRTGWFDGIDYVIVLPQGRDDAFEHEAIHSIMLALTGDGDFDHNGAPWQACEAARVKS